MKSSLKDQAASKAYEIKGKVQGVAGRITGNLKLDYEGATEKIGGKVQQTIGEAGKILDK